MNKYLYYNDKFICLGMEQGKTTLNQEIVQVAENNEETLKKAIEEFLASGNKKNLFIRTNDSEKVFEQVKTNFKFIVAAGGLIQNNNKFLFIKRLGKWDLPKGKLDKGESIEHAAIRECEEECGVTGLKIIKKLPDTYHIYEHKKGFALKISHWYLMETSSNKDLVPQTEENIEEAKWLGIDEIRSIVFKNTYITIETLVKEFFLL